MFSIQENKLPTILDIFPHYSPTVCFLLEVRNEDLVHEVD